MSWRTVGIIFFVAIVAFFVVQPLIASWWSNRKLRIRDTKASLRRENAALREKIAQMQSAALKREGEHHSTLKQVRQSKDAPKWTDSNVIYNRFGKIQS